VKIDDCSTFFVENGTVGKPIEFAPDLGWVCAYIEVLLRTVREDIIPIDPRVEPIISDYSHILASQQPICMRGLPGS
jgi:hypothetical protein